MPGKCPRCAKSVGAAEEKLALGKSWHLECFTCSICNRGLDSMTLAESRELREIYCKNCYRLFIGPDGYGYGPNGPSLITYDLEVQELPANPQNVTHAQGVRWKVLPSRLGKNWLHSKGTPAYYSRAGGKKGHTLGTGPINSASRPMASAKISKKSASNSPSEASTLTKVSKGQSPILSPSASVKSSKSKMPKVMSGSKPPPPPPPLPKSNSNTKIPKKSPTASSNIPPPPPLPKSNSNPKIPKKNSPKNNKSPTASGKIPIPPPMPASPKSSSNSKISKGGKKSKVGSGSKIPPPPPPPPSTFTTTTTINLSDVPSTKTKKFRSTNSETEEMSEKGSNLRSPVASRSKMSPSRSNRSRLNRFPGGSTTKGASQMASNTNAEASENKRGDNPEDCPPDFYCGGGCVPTPSPRFPPRPDAYPKRIPLGKSYGSIKGVPKGLGEKCRRCGRPVYLAELQLGYHGAYHTECFACCACGKKLDSTNVAEHQGEIFCTGCYKRNFATSGVGFGIGAGTLQTP